MPAWCRLSARLSPPIPAPTTITCMPLRVLPCSQTARGGNECRRLPLLVECSLCGGPDVPDRLEPRELDVVQLAVRLLDLADIDVVDHVAGLAIGRHHAPRTFPGHPLHGGCQRLAV